MKTYIWAVDQPSSLGKKKETKQINLHLPAPRGTTRRRRRHSQPCNGTEHRRRLPLPFDGPPPKTTPRQLSHRSPPNPSSSAWSRSPTTTRDLLLSDPVRWNVATLLTGGIRTARLNRGIGVGNHRPLARGIGRHCLKESRWLVSEPCTSVSLQIL
jgi:hypothetical protein